MNFKYSVLDFCPRSCQLEWEHEFFILSLSFPADLAEVRAHTHTKGMHRAGVNISRAEKKQKYISKQCLSKWMTGLVPSVIDLLYKALEWAR